MYTVLCIDGNHRLINLYLIVVTNHEDQERYMAGPLGRSFIGETSVTIQYLNITLLMVAYFCHHLSDNYVDLSDNYVDLSDLYVDLSDHYVDLSENYHHN